ncbi:MAG TPA: hypothetical protein VM029_07335, partial [Opitutaceae bacterium]|nr:hypothetical protein [Opitutaceae bacterium]
QPPKLDFVLHSGGWKPPPRQAPNAAQIFGTLRPDAPRFRGMFFLPERRLPAAERIPFPFFGGWKPALRHAFDHISGRRVRRAACC